MKIDENCSEVVATISQTSILMKKSVRSLFRVFLLLVFAATLGCRAAIRAVFTELQFEKSFVAGAPPAPAFNSTLLRFASIDIGEAQSKQEIEQLLEGSFVGAGRQRSFSTWRRFNHHVEDRARTSTGVPVSALLRSPKFYRYWLEFRRILQDWDRKKRYEPDIMMDLVKLVKHQIDLHRGAVMASDRKYQSCAVVGNSGILLNREYGRFIDGHDFVIRLNNARVEGFRLHVGNKTTLSFVNSNILHLCARREGCFCHPYGVEIPMILYICQPAHFLDYTFCNATHKAPLLITDPRFDVLCARIVKYYSLKRSIVENGKSLKEWVAAKGGAMFHYSSGVQAVMLALGICEKVSIFGFGKSASSKHHYHTNQKTELKLHDYEAEYDFYYDLVERPQVIPFISSNFKFPRVTIYQ